MSIKRILTVLILIIGLVLIVACSPNVTNSQPEVVSTQMPVVQATDNPFSVAKLGNCYNPYNPAIEGKVWKYAMTSGTTPSTMDISYKNVTPDSFTSIQQFSNISTELNWTCNADGLISSQFANMSIAQIPNLQIQTIEVKGVVVPKEDKWQVGYSWNTGYTIKVKFGSGDAVFEGQGVISLKNTISSIESISVPSGKYDNAFRVDVSGTFNMSVNGAENNVPLTYSNWFVKNVGMVKSGSFDPNLPYSIELISYQ
jgi:hypothetical protein